MTVLEQVKMLIGVADKDSIINVLIAQAENDFKQLTNRESVPESAQNIITSMTIEKYNGIGTEGLSGTSYSGVSESYIDGYSDTIRKALVRYKKVKML